MPNACRSSSTAERTGICTDLYELTGAVSHINPAALSHEPALWVTLSAYFFPLSHFSAIREVFHP